MSDESLSVMSGQLDIYDDDFSGESVLVTPFELVPTSLGELAGRGTEDENIDPDSIVEEEGETYAQMISNARVRAALKRPIRLCKYAGVPVCLMILEIELAETKQMPRLLRFKSVEVTVEFRDAEGVAKLGPEIVMFCPEKYTGKPTFVMHKYCTTVGTSIDTSSALPVGLGFGFQRSHTEHFSKTSYIGIEGRAPRMGQRNPIAKWNIKEDEALKQGVPKQLRLVIAVKNPGERAFNMKLNFSANLGFNAVEFRVKKKESVLSTKVDPKLLRERALNDEHGPEHGRIWQCYADESELDALMLEKLTNLKGSEVGIVSAFG
jgi:hypothetical protein